MKRKYRIVSDEWNGYEVQVKYRFLPFWVQCWSGRWPTNTHSSLEKAEDFVKQHRAGFPAQKRKIYKTLD